MADIKDRAREYVAEHSEYSEVFGQTFVAVDTLTAMVEFAEQETKELEQKLETERNSRIALVNKIAELEAQIEIDAKQIRALQKQNGELTDKVNDLEDKLANADYQLEGRDNEIRELKEQIEKMKCCYNCSKWNEGLLLCNDSTVRVTTYADYCCEDWEIKEK